MVEESVPDSYNFLPFKHACQIHHRSKFAEYHTEHGTCSSKFNAIRQQQFNKKSDEDNSYKLFDDKCIALRLHILPALKIAFEYGGDGNNRHNWTNSHQWIQCPFICQQSCCNKWCCSNHANGKNNTGYGGYEQ